MHHIFSPRDFKLTNFIQWESLKSMHWTSVFFIKHQIQCLHQWWESYGWVQMSKLSKADQRPGGWMRQIRKNIMCWAWRAWIYSSNDGMCCFRKLKFKKRKRKQLQTFYGVDREHKGLPRWHSDKESSFQCRRCGFDPWIRKIPWRRKRQPTPVLLPGESQWWRSLVGYSPWGRNESNTTEQL